MFVSEGDVGVGLAPGDERMQTDRQYDTIKMEGCDNEIAGCSVLRELPRVL